jgi:Putative phage tail protein
MATLVLSAVGSAIGGPIGGAIGSIIGQQIDAAIFAPKPREGARLKELAVQTSSYGSQIPAIFGTMRVAGTVIWATDLVEKRAKSGGGKGRPSTVNYSYSVSLAVALSSRPISHVGRIWADGNLLRGSAGDLKVDTQLRIYTGHEDQLLDPLMASAEEVGQCPAYRGIACAVFEDLQLADFGNRIPSLTFELFERGGQVPVMDIFGAASNRKVKGTSAHTVTGFALGGGSANEAVAPLIEVLPIQLGVRSGELVITDTSSGATNVREIVPVGMENGEKYDPPRRTLESSGAFPYALALRYYDPSRDFQTSLQRSERGQFSYNVRQIDLPAVLDAATAKHVADQRLFELQGGRAKWRGQIASTSLRLFPGDAFWDETGQKWTIEQLEHERGSTGILARAVTEHGAMSGQPATPGRSLPAPDMAVGATRMAVIEMPASGFDDPAKPVVAIYAAGTGAGWRRAALSLRRGPSLVDVGTTALPAIMGTQLDPLPLHNPHLIDENAGLRVQLLNDAMEIPNRMGSPLDIDAPYFWLNGEFVRCGVCQDLGGGIYRLKRLQRGCFQSSVSAHPVNSPFVLVESETARLIDGGSFSAGDVASFEALGLGDAVPVTGFAIVKAISITPLAPIHGVATRLPNGSVTFHWTRRSRVDGGWVGGVDQLMVEGQEKYMLSLTANGIIIDEWAVFEPSVTIDPAALEIPGSALISLAIRQVGRYAQSPPLFIDII